MNDFVPNAERMMELAGAVCNQTASTDETAELNVIVREDEELCRRYLQYCQIHIALRMELRADRAAESACRQTHELSLSAGLSSADTPEIQPPSSPPLGIWNNLVGSTIGFFSQEVPFSLLLATVITCLGLWAGSNVYVTHHRQLPTVARSTNAMPRPSMLGQRVVARVTGAAGCAVLGKAATGRWLVTDEPNRKPERISQNSLISLGDTFCLAAGQLEITYDSGARVILQGPATYQVDAPDGGFLSVGKLTARLEKRGERGEEREKKKVASGQWSVASEERSGGRVQGTVVANHKSEIINHKFVAPSFAVRTPNATVTDLGTEFGVYVQKNSAVEVQVFQGCVEVAPNGRNAKTAAFSFPKQRVTAGEAYRFAKSEAIPLAASARPTFLRQLATHDPNRRLCFGLVAYWAFDDAANLGKNSVGSGDLDPVNSPEYCETGKLGGSLKLFGRARNSILAFHNGQGVPTGVPTGKSSCSISAWLRPNPLQESSSKMGILSWGDWKTMHANVYVIGRMSGNDFVQNYWVNNDERDAYAFVDKETFSQGWHHVVCTYDKGLCRIFVDGQWRGSRGSSICPEFGGNNFAVGRGWFYNSPGEVFDGCLDEIAIWNRELSDDDIRQLFNDGAGINPLAGLSMKISPVSQPRSVQPTKEENRMKNP